jgi:hypothetical protein
MSDTHEVTLLLAEWAKGNQKARSAICLRKQPLLAV